MSRLPPHHLYRPRLTSPCLDFNVVVVEAGAGWGKTVLAAELVDVWRSVGIDVVLHEGGVPASLFIAHLRRAVAHAGFTEAAATIARTGDDTAAAVDTLLDALAAERCTIVIDDAHHAERDAALLIGRLAARLEGEQRLIVLARQLPDGAERLRRGDWWQLGPADLALRPEETLELCRSGFDLDVGPLEAAAVDRATGGWTAAAVLAAARARRTGEDIAAVARAAERTSGPSSAVATLLDEVLTTLAPAQRRLLAQVGRLPLIDRDVVDDATQIDGFFDRSVAAGLPFTPGGDGWSDLPGPVRDQLASLAEPDPVVLGRAAARYGRRGRLSAALQLLLASGDSLAAARQLSEGTLASIEAMDVLEFQAVVDRLSSEAIGSYPDVLVHLARACEMAALLEARTEVLDQVSVLAERLDDPRLERAIAAERANDLIRDGAFDEGERMARHVLQSASTDEWLTRARSESALGRCTCWHLDSEGRVNARSLRQAERHFTRSLRIYDQLGMPAARAGLIPYLAMWIDFALGHAGAALARLDDALGLVANQPRRRAFLLVQHAEVSLELGRHDQCQADVREARLAAEKLDAQQLLAYCHWQLMQAASYRRDADETVEEARLTEVHRADWWSAAGADFLADAAECLDRVGHGGLAWEYLRRAQANPGDAEPLIAMAEGALLARHGDPEAAEAFLLTVPGHRVQPREYWRITLLRAYAAFRRGDGQAGALAARAFEEAARVGLAHLPLTKEWEITGELLALAVDTGQPAALALQVTEIPVSLSVLGGFVLTRGGRPVPVAAGQTSQLLKLVAVSGGRVVAEQAIDALWPDADREAGRNRLRTVLNRQRTEAGEVIVRNGDALQLAPEVHVDLAQFELEARRALALGLAEPTLAVAVARAAIARYRGELLPDDPYAEWAERPRERARRTMLQLLDLCADAAAQRGDLDEARRVVELSIDLAPYDDERYLRAAAALLEQGHRGAALTILRRARAALAELGIQPPLHLLSLEKAIVA